MQNPIRFNTSIHVDITDRMVRDALDADKLTNVELRVVQGQKIDTITSVRHMQPDEKGYLITEFIIQLKE